MRGGLPLSKVRCGPVLEGFLLFYGWVNIQIKRQSPPKYPKGNIKGSHLRKSIVATTLTYVQDKIH